MHVSGNRSSSASKMLTTIRYIATRTSCRGLVTNVRSSPCFFLPGALTERLSEALEVFREQRLEFARIEMVGSDHPQFQNLDSVRAVTFNHHIATKVLELRSFRLTGARDEPHFQCVAFLRLQPTPEPRRVRRANGHRVAHVPLELKGRADFAK